MDVIQAGILNFRLKELNKTILQRRINANYYLRNIDRKFFKIIDEKKYQFNTYHTFVIQTRLRNKLKKYLQKKKYLLQYIIQYQYIYNRHPNI